jgi:transcription elongation factor GreA
MDKKDTIYITKDGLKKLKGELSELVDVKRLEMAKKIKEAREMGDISENSAYDDARQEQAFIEGRIGELEEIIKNAVIREIKVKDSVDVGAKVVLHIEGDEEEFHIVGATEADPLNRKISHESPLGSALIGKKVGEKIKVEAPVGDLIYTILKIAY